MAEVYDTVGKLVPVASIDAAHGIVEFSVFEKDVTPELMQGFENIADASLGDPTPAEGRSTSESPP